MNSLINLSAQQLRRAAQIKDQIGSLQRELAKILGTTAPKQSVEKPRRRGKLTAAGRAKISAAAKARWAKIKSAKK